VYTLEKVLKLRKDHVTQVEFLEEAMAVLVIDLVYRLCSFLTTRAETGRKSDIDLLACSRQSPRGSDPRRYEGINIPPTNLEFGIYQTPSPVP
jgi:hypothetical protein